MTQISAADNHLITITDDRWRLTFKDRPIAETSARGFRYAGRFGVTRGLPEDGLLQKESILQVVLGWQQNDEAWHLGLILEQGLAEKRGSRWCELVHWPDPDITVFQDLAQETGQNLAQALGVPFYVIPPQRVVTPKPPRPLPALPLEFGEWRLTQVDDSNRRFVLQRTKVWSRRILRKAAWYGFWAVIYLIISLATIISPIALPNTGTLIPDPQVLPYLGLVISGGLVVMMIYQLYEWSTKHTQIYIDGVRGVISAWRNKQMYWHVPQIEVQSVYVSEIVKKNDYPATEYGEINIHLGGGNFHYIAQHEEPENNDTIPQSSMTYTPEEDAMYELERDMISSNLQAVAMYIAGAMEHAPVWYDVRVK